MSEQQAAPQMLIPSCSNCPFARKVKLAAQAILAKGMAPFVCAFNPPQATHLVVPMPGHGNALGIKMHADFPPVEADAVCGQHPVLKAQYTAETMMLAQEAIEMRKASKELANAPTQGS